MTPSDSTAGRRETVVVTGASRGIGLAIATDLIADGYTVVSLGRSPPPASLHVAHYEANFAAGTAWTTVLPRMVAEHTDIRALVVNAATPLFGVLENVPETSIVQALEVNLVAPILLVRSLLPQLKRAAPSTIVAIASESATRAGGQGSIYCAAKFGLRGFMLSLREECARDGVRCTLIHPGMVRTGWFDRQSFTPASGSEHAITPNDVAAAVSYALRQPPDVVIDELALTPRVRKVIKRSRSGSADHP